MLKTHFKTCNLSCYRAKPVVHYHANVLGRQKVSSTGSVQNVINLAVKSTDGKTAWVYIINKEQSKEVMNVLLALDGFKAKTNTATGFNGDDNSGDSLPCTM